MALSAPIPLPSEPDLCVWTSALTQSELAGAVERVRLEKLRGISLFTGRLLDAAHLLDGTEIKLIAAVGFPFGGMDADAKRFEVECAIDAGAQEIDFFLNTGRLKERDFAQTLRELRDAVEAADERPLNAVLQPAQLDSASLPTIIDVIVDSEAKCLSLWRPTNLMEDLKMARARLGPKFEIKVFLKATALSTLPDLRQAGATRFGMEQN